MSAPSLLLRSTVDGPDADADDDPAELYHEASKLYPSLWERQGAGIARLAADARLQSAARRPGRCNAQLPAFELPAPEPPQASLWDALKARRSAPPPPGPPLCLPALAAVLTAAYGAAAPGRRTAPSGGALYPLELYVAVTRVDGLPPGVFHLDPERRVLELLREEPPADALAGAVPLHELVADAAAVVVLTAVFRRTRVKYGLRGYRFALLEAGHVVQNALLAATALGVPSLPLGGFYDARVEELLGVDGVDESVVHAVVLGGSPA